MTVLGESGSAYRDTRLRERYEKLRLRASELRVLRHEKEKVDASLRAAALHKEEGVTIAALTSRRQEIEGHLVDQDATLRELASLRVTLGEKVALGQVKVASPCNAEWAAMGGDDRARHCSDCNRNVYNLSGMTQAEATDFVALNEANAVCVRFYRRPDGTMLHADCPKGATAVLGKRKRTRFALLGAAFLSLGGATLFGVLRDRERARKDELQAPAASMGSLE